MVSSWFARSTDFPENSAGSLRALEKLIATPADRGNLLSSSLTKFFKNQIF
jgi:hypothetical protein